MKKLFYRILIRIKVCSIKTVNSIKRSSKLRQFNYEVEVIAEKLSVPWAIDVSQEGKIYFTERSGRIRVIENGKLNTEPLITLGSPFISQGEGGLMGIVLDPNFSQNHYIYVMHTYMESNQIYNRVIRLVENNNKASIDKIILDKIPGGQIHNGGRIKIGPDKKLYITTGDAGNSNLAQDSSSLAGKILRINLDGSIPNDNPISGSPVYSLGHRNPQGLAWNSKNMLYESEHGQSAHDEINIIEPGANYGWPLVQGDEDLTNFNLKKPIIHSGEETWAPSGIAFINKGARKDNLLVSTLRGQKLLVMSFDKSGTKVTNIETLFENKYGRLREVVVAQDGSIYISTSNRDGRGEPAINDDRILRVVLK